MRTAYSMIAVGSWVQRARFSNSDTSVKSAFDLSKAPFAGIVGINGTSVNFGALGSGSVCDVQETANIMPMKMTVQEEKRLLVKGGDT